MHSSSNTSCHQKIQWIQSNWSNSFSSCHIFHWKKKILIQYLTVECETILNYNRNYGNNESDIWSVNFLQKFEWEQWVETGDGGQNKSCRQVVLVEVRQITKYDSHSSFKLKFWFVLTFLCFEILFDFSADMTNTVTKLLGLQEECTEKM